MSCLLASWPTVGSRWPNFFLRRFPSCAAAPRREGRSTGRRRSVSFSELGRCVPGDFFLFFCCLPFFSVLISSACLRVSERMRKRQRDTEKAKQGPLILSRLEEFFSKEFVTSLYEKEDGDVRKFLESGAFVRNIRASLASRVMSFVCFLWCCRRCVRCDRCKSCGRCVFSSDLLRAEEKARDLHADVSGIWRLPGYSQV